MNISFSNKPILKTVLCLILIVIAGMVFWVWRTKSPSIQSKEFKGQLLKIEGNIAFLKGAYIVDTKAYKPEDLIERQVTITAQTKITKTILYPLSQEELKKRGGVFYPEELKNETRDVDFEALKKDADLRVLGLDIKTSENIFNKQKIIAAEVNYRVMFFQDWDSVK